MSDWSDTKKYKFETIRSCIFALTAFLAALSIVKPYEKIEKLENLINRQALSAVSEAVYAFSNSGYSYTSATADLISPVYSETKQEKWEATFGDFRNAMNSLTIFVDSPELNEPLEQLECVRLLLKNDIKQIISLNQSDNQESKSKFLETLKQAEDTRQWLKNWNVYVSQLALHTVSIRKNEPKKIPRSCLNG